MLQEPVSSPTDAGARIWKDVYCHIFGLPPSMTDLESLDDLIRIGATVRQATRSGGDMSMLLGGPTWARKAIATLCLAGKASSTYDTFMAVSSTI